MRKSDLHQGTEAWLAWRKNIITATDAAVILGKSPYCTEFELHQRKLGLIPEQKINVAMLRGQADEPIARAMFIEQFGIEVEPACIESEIHPYLGASLDGISKCGKYIVEIKSNSKARHENVRLDIIPEDHIIQMQHQMLCGDGEIEKGFYVSYNDGEILVRQVLPDLAWQQMYIPKAQAFFENLLFHEKPKLSNKDYVTLENLSPLDDDLIKQYETYDNQIKQLTKLKQECKDKIIHFANGNSFETQNLKVLKKIIPGRIDYEAIPEIKHINLDEYRKPSTESWMIMFKGN